MKTIVNKVIGTETTKWDELKSYEFNELKDNSSRDITKLKNSIVNNGFSFPFYIWNDHRFVIDGTGRKLALLELEKEGYEIQECPIVRIEADTLKQAKKLVLQASSKHGEITQESLYEFTVDIPEVENLIDEVDFYEFNMEFGKVNQQDYSLLDEVDDNQVESMASEVKKAIQIEFTPEDYERAYELCQYARRKKVYIGEHLINLLQNIKDEYENT